ncbi:MAG TPA: M20/M25/M40 family metallo-hydrolase [Rectinemataceae bacterium]|nr:M20/M25/M40 family metallo-hydrolase [Rectinemataceae bacterium]
MDLSGIVVLSCAGVLFALLLVVLLRAALTRRPAAPGQALAPESLDAARGVEERLAALVRRPTVSWFDYGRTDKAAFEAFKADLVRLFPRLHDTLPRREIGEWALLYEWKGRDPSLAPVILCSHFDVVPGDDEPEWTHPPFAGAIAEGYVWGRGSQDVKVTLASILDSAERLVAEGFSPLRTVYFAFGGDEEVGGPRGAGAVAAWLASQGIRASFLLDEGGPIADGLLSFADRPLALVGVAEKGYIDVVVEAGGAGGHASMPPKRTAAGDLARAVAAIEANPSPARLSRSVRAFLERVAPYTGFTYRLLFRNLWLFSGLVKAAFSATPSSNALVRTTTAPTMLEGSSKENVLAEKARANINVRIIPGDSSPGVLERLGRLVEPFGCTVRQAHEGLAVEPLPESSVEAEGYHAIESALATSFPEAACVPFLFSAGTDTKHYRDVAENIYRLTPLRQTSKDLAGIHARDERTSIENVRRCALFYTSLMRGL